VEISEVFSKDMTSLNFFVDFGKISLADEAIMALTPENVTKL